MMDDDDSIGWGRPRPNVADLLPSTPEHSDDEGDAPKDIDMPDSMPTEGEGLEQDAHADIKWLRVAALVDYPLTGYDGVPQGELNQMYVSEKLLNQGQVQKMKKFYTTWTNGENSPKTRFVCVFTCPVSGEHFACGEWETEKGVTMIDDVGWYTTKKLAMNAAAARTLDCFSLRRCQGTEKSPFKRCLDSPYLVGGAPKLPELPSDVVLPLPFVNDDDGVEEKVAFTPKKDLHEWYLSFSKKLDSIGIMMDDPENKNGPQKVCYTSWSNEKDQHDLRFTAMFTCHLTGERFASGKLNGEEDTFEENYWYYREGMLIPRWDETIEEDSDGGVGDHLGLQKIYFVWYKTKKEAENAAAGRAVDCMRHRDLPNDAIDDKRYCKELPYSVENTPEVLKLLSGWSYVTDGVPLPSLPDNCRLTTQFDVPCLHSLIEEDCDEKYWFARYNAMRHAE